MRPSLSSELLARLLGCYTNCYLLVTFLLLLWKRSVLPYPAVNLGSELALVALLAAGEWCRLLLARRANLTQRPLAALVSLALTAPAALAVCYFLLWQTYVLRLELVMASTQLALMTAHTIAAAAGLAAPAEQ